VTESEKICLIFTNYTCMLYSMYLLFWVSYNNSVSFNRPSSDWCVSGKIFKWISCSEKKLLMKFKLWKYDQNLHAGFLRPSHNCGYLIMKKSFSTKFYFHNYSIIFKSHRTILTVFLFGVREFATGFFQAISLYTTEVTEVSLLKIIHSYICMLIYWLCV